ncbi:hypothetical protein HQ496_00455 [bacterium]|nr:hypothetical protein [bacterium]
MASDKQNDVVGELPGQQAMFEAEEENGKSSKSRTRGSVHLKGTRSLESLRIRIELAAKELYRLREENHQLHRELEAMRVRGNSSTEGTSIVFGESAASLQSKLESYIRVVDRYIEQEQTAEEDGENDS